MTATIEHSPEEAKSRFKLGSGVGDGKSTACAMSALAWAHGYAFTDTMPCAHRTLRSLVISANDAKDATEADRWALFDAGEAGGVVDTWWVPTEVVVSFMAQVDREASRVVQTLDVLAKVKAWKEATNKGLKPDLSGAVLSGADLSDAVGTPWFGDANGLEDRDYWPVGEGMTTRDVFAFNSIDELLPVLDDFVKSYGKDAERTTSEFARGLYRGKEAAFAHVAAVLREIQDAPKASAA